MEEGESETGKEKRLNTVITKKTIIVVIRT